MIDQNVEPGILPHILATVIMMRCSLIRSYWTVAGIQQA